MVYVNRPCSFHSHCEIAALRDRVRFTHTVRPLRCETAEYRGAIVSSPYGRVKSRSEAVSQSKRSKDGLLLSIKKQKYDKISIDCSIKCIY